VDQSRLSLQVEVKIQRYDVLTDSLSIDTLHQLLFRIFGMQHIGYCFYYMSNDVRMVNRVKV
jgi:hypothetical protein